MTFPFPMYGPGLVGAGVWSTALALTQTAAEGMATGLTFVMKISSGAFSGVSGSKVRLSLTAPSAGGCTISDFYFGELATGDNFTGDQVHCFYSGSNSIVIPSSTTIVLDQIDYAFSSTKNYAIAYYATGGPSEGYLSNVNTLYRYSSIPVNSSASTTKTGFLGATAVIALLTKIEVFN